MPRRRDVRDIVERTVDGRPVDRSCEDSSNATYARKLRGALMLIVGDLDINVDIDHAGCERSE